MNKLTEDKKEVNKKKKFVENKDQIRNINKDQERSRDRKKNINRRINRNTDRDQDRSRKSPKKGKRKRKIKMIEDRKNRKKRRKRSREKKVQAHFKVNQVDQKVGDGVLADLKNARRKAREDMNESIL